VRIKPGAPRDPGRRPTRQRALVARALQRQPRAVSAQELHRSLRRDDPRLGLATVYRALEAQVARGTARRFERQGHVSAYVACPPGHHHHVICDRCQRVSEIPEDLLRSMLRAVEARDGFRIDHASLDLYGTCADCQRKTRSVGRASAS
jgi:Fur family ferric uptake transcriptional regulator